MATVTEADPTDAGTQRPNIKPTRKVGTKFKPIKLRKWDPKITLPEGCDPTKPLDLWMQYYTDEMIDIIVSHTNQHPREPANASQSKARAYNFPKNRYEKHDIYLYLAIRIYLQLHPEYDLESYWDQRSSTPYHPFTSLITRDVFMELRMRYRVNAPNPEDLWDRVCIAPSFLA